MSYEITLEQIMLPSHRMTVDVVVEIDDGRAGEWGIESISIVGDEDDLFIPKNTALFNFIKDAIMADKAAVNHIDSEAEENNNPSLARDPDWY